MSNRISSIRLTEDMVQGLAAMAKRRDRSVNFLVGVAVKRMLSEDEKLSQAVNDGIEQLDDGLGISHEDVKCRTQAIIDRALTKQVS